MDSTPIARSATAGSASSTSQTVKAMVTKELDGVGRASSRLQPPTSASRLQPSRVTIICHHSSTPPVSL
ncbi:hypothetical protein HN51_005028, partial [Arachis hypogaea]